MNRREFAQICLYGAMGLTLGGGGVQLLGSGRKALPLLLVPLTEIGDGAIIDFPQHGIIVVRSAKGLSFLSNRCTHLGCPLRPVGHELVCPCHGGRFSLTGAALAGPPRSSLSWFRGGITEERVVYVIPDAENEARTYVPI